VFCTERDSCGQDGKVSGCSDRVSLDTQSHMQPVADDYCIQNVQEVDIKDEVTATDTDSCSNVCTSHSTTPLSSCSDHDLMETRSHMEPVVDNYCVSNVQEVDIKDEASTTDTDSYSNMSTSQSTTQLSYCSDHVSADSSSSQLTEHHVHVESRTGDSIKPRTGVYTCKRRVTCPVCSKSLQFDSLRLHMRTHSGYRPYSCDVCRWEFARNADLTTHLRVHSGERPFTCSVCQKQFSHKSAMSRHELLHTCKLPFRCSVCSVQFITASDLNVHLRRHYGKRPYTCQLCAKNFVTSNELKTHVRSHDAQRSFTCFVCCSKFSYATQLKEHVQTHVCSADIG